MSDPLGWEDLVVGRVYEVTWDDCCVSGRFTSALDEVRRSERDPVSIATLVFDNGVQLTDGHYGYVFEAQPEGARLCVQCGHRAGQHDAGGCRGCACSQPHGGTA